MCTTCGCSGVTTGPHDHDHQHEVHHDHGHQPHRGTGNATPDPAGRLLQKNDRIAAATRAWLAARQIRAFNLVSSPGAGKTTLLERTIGHLQATISVSVIEGDQATSRDAERIQAAGAPVVQINTGTGCHLDAEMVRGGIDTLKPAARSVLFIENVGNLVCPALFDLGEEAKVLVASVAEGEDKPLKYPHMFRASRVLVLNKVDLLPHVQFDVGRFEEHARRVNPHILLFPGSAVTGAGLDRWYSWLRDLHGHK